MSNSDKYIGNVDYATTTFIGTSNDGYTLENSFPAVVLTVDGVEPNVGDLILVKDQSSSIDNGVYEVIRLNSVVDNVGYLLNRVCMEVERIYTIFVKSGDTQSMTWWCTDLGVDPYTPGVTPQVFTQIPLNGGGGTVDLQTAYDNSTAGVAEIVFDSTRGGLSLQDAVVPIGSNLLEVQNNGGSTTYFSVDTSGATIDGKLTVTGLIDPTGLQLESQAANPGSVTATNGTFWVQTGAPTLPYFTDSTGTDYNLLNAGAVNLQMAYDEGPTGEINLDSGVGGIIISDEAGGGIGSNLFDVQNTSSSSIFAVDASGATVTGKLTVTGLIDPTGLQCTEQSANPGVVAGGNGTFWVRDDSPNVPVFTNDAGTDYVVNSFLGNSDTPSTFVANSILAVNNGGTAVEFSNNWQGTNTDITGSSLALIDGSNVGSNTGAIAIGNNATVTTNNCMAYGVSGSNDVSETMVFNYMSMVHNTSSVGILSGSAWAGLEVSLASDIIDLTSVATTTITLPANVMIFINQIDIIKLNISDTPTAATIDFGITGNNDAFISGLSFGSSSENTVGFRSINTALLTTDGVTSLVIDVTIGGTVSSGVHEARVVFKGYILRDE